MRKRELLKLAKMLRKDAVDPEGIQFYLYEWGHVSNPSRPLSCDTTACAMGLAALSGAFPGLKGKLLRRGSLWITYRSPINGKLASDAFTSAMDLFQIDSCQANFLFTSIQGLTQEEGAKGEIQVAARIEAFVRLNGDLKKLQRLKFGRAK